MERFAAIDTETANAQGSSICQIGVAIFHNGEVTEEWETLINPQTHFSEINIDIHGIHPEHVRNAPTFAEITKKLESLLSEIPTVSHTPFDRIALLKSYQHNSISPPELQWVDSAKITRRAWPQFAKSGFGLSKISQYLNIQFKHHDALEDAKAAGQVVMAAQKHLNLSLQDLIEAQTKPNTTISTTSTTPTAKTISELQPNPQGPLFGEIACFTGSLSMTRKEAAAKAASLGCEVGTGVNKQTTLLIVGDQDINRLAGKEKSSKHLKAEALINKGQPIRIISESDFTFITG